MARKPKPKLKVWYVDDLQANLDRFAQDHTNDFDITTFTNLALVQRRFDASEYPDVLLCDIFFYDTAAQAANIEQQVSDKLDELREFAHSINADLPRYQAGIPFLETVARQFGAEPKFVAFAYTSKGPFLLGQDGFDRVARSGAKWLFKRKYGTQTEAQLLTDASQEFRVSHSKWLLVWRRAKSVLAWTGLLSGVVGWFIGEALKRLLTAP
jgi:hypothetical protein